MQPLDSFDKPKLLARFAGQFASYLVVNGISSSFGEDKNNAVEKTFYLAYR